MSPLIYLMWWQQYGWAATDVDTMPRWVLAMLLDQGGE